MGNPRKPRNHFLIFTTRLRDGEILDSYSYIQADYFTNQKHIYYLTRNNVSNITMQYTGNWVIKRHSTLSVLLQIFNWWSQCSGFALNKLKKRSSLQMPKCLFILCLPYAQCMWLSQYVNTLFFDKFLM